MFGLAPEQLAGSTSAHSRNPAAASADRGTAASRKSGLLSG
jgi:hypothetical protein